MPQQTLSSISTTPLVPVGAPFQIGSPDQVDRLLGNVLPREVTALQFLSSLREFSKIPASELKLLADSSRVATYSSGQYVTNEGDEESGYGFIVISGCLAMSKTSINGKNLIVELLQAGDIFGMLLMLAADRKPAQLTARAIKASKVLRVPIDKFTHLLNAHPVLFKDFVAHLLVCLQSSYRLSRGLAHDKVEVRIAAVLSSLALKFASSPISGSQYTINFTRQQIADLTGTTPETAIRVTRKMQRDRLIDIKRPGVISILDLNTLSNIVES